MTARIPPISYLASLDNGNFFAMLRIRLKTKQFVFNPIPPLRQC